VYRIYFFPHIPILTPSIPSPHQPSPLFPTSGIRPLRVCCFRFERENKGYTDARCHTRAGGALAHLLLVRERAGGSPYSAWGVRTVGSPRLSASIGADDWRLCCGSRTVGVSPLLPPCPRPPLASLPVGIPLCHAPPASLCLTLRHHPSRYPPATVPTVKKRVESHDGGVQIRMKSEAVCFLSGSCPKTHASVVFVFS
jgi:hypothetical protein